MDPTGRDSPCVIQALAAPPPPPGARTLVQAARDDQPSATPTDSPRPMRRLPPGPGPDPEPPSPRRTRSGGAPGWTTSETLALVAEFAAVNDGWSRTVSDFQKWAIVAKGLASSDWGGSSHCGRPRGRRSAGECRRRWEALDAAYRAVRRWELQLQDGGRVTYWEMDAAARRKARLPAEFDAEVYGAVDALTLVQEALLPDGAVAGGGGAEEEEEEEEVEGLVGAADAADPKGGEVGKEEEDGEAGEEDEEEAAVEEDDGNDEDEDDMHADGGNAAASDDLEVCEMETNNEPRKSQSDAWELANKLHENTQHIHMILSEEAGEDADQNHTVAGFIPSDAVDTTRQKADELINSLGDLVSYLNQFTDLIKENGFESIVGMN